MKTLKTAIMLALTLVLVTGAVAEDAKKREKGKAVAKKGERKAPGVTARFTAKLDLSAEQKEKVAGIDKEFAAKAAEIKKATDAILTKEQIEARNAAMKKARESKDPEARKAVQQAVKLSDDQKKKMDEVNKSRQELNGQVLAALKKVLTEEQIKSLPQAGRGAEGKGKKPAGDKKKKKDAAK
ncbi:MAG: hypothetical protein HQ518_31455 [Rhodopirellula sp.]|nr:hypothetical protein [Rhodopirellula sp.]